MKIQDPRGKVIIEATVQLSDEELTEVLVAASQIEDGSLDHAVVTDSAGNSLALYKQSDALQPLERQVDWWLGPVLLLIVLLTGIGIFTVARSLLELLF